MMEAAIIRGAAQKSQWLLTDRLTPLLGKRHTDGKLGVFAHRVQPGQGSPPHIHRNEDEGFYILRGELTFLAGDAMFAAGPGTFVWGPRDLIHCFRCTSSMPAEAVLIVTPTNFFDFADALAVPAGESFDPPPVTPELVNQLISTAPRFGIELKMDHVMPTVVGSAAGASKKMWVMGEHVSYLATSEQTSGQLTVVEILTAPAGGPPPHAHTKEDEIIYVIDGRHEFMLHDRTDIAGPGDLVFIPHGTRHRYTNPDATAGKLLSVHTPGGFERFFDECGVDAGLHPVAPKTAPPPQEAVHALMARHGMTP